jgi:hypothetical protein
LNDSYGISNEDFANVKDARVIEIVKDAMKYRMGKKVTEKKISQPILKFQKPSGKPVNQKSKLDQLTKVAKSAKGFNKKNAQTAAITELLLNS